MQITIDDFAEAFGEDVISITGFVENYKQCDFGYDKLTQQERDRELLNCLKFNDNDTQKIRGEGRTEAWERGWGENLKEFRENKEESCFTPKFVKPTNVFRWKKDFIRPHDPLFERYIIKMIQSYLFPFYMSDKKHVYEFGCGSGLNLFAIANMLPDIEIIGTDFVQPAVDIAKEMADYYSFNMRSEIFNMLTPNDNLQIDDNSCVFTWGAIEQLSSSFKPFIDYLIRGMPKICFHIEPTVELYDEESLIDYLAIQLHHKRGYTKGLLGYLKQLHSQKVIELIKVKRLFCGSSISEGYQLMVWRPL